ncbi:MAG: metallopeptidase TldD-related protein, partial [Erysipelotrichaceae bacterium]
YFDGNGIVLKSKKLIENGMVKNLYGDIQYGSYLDIKNITGNYTVMELVNNDKPITKQAMKKEKHLIVSYFSSPQLDESTGYFGGEVRLAFYYDGEKYIPLTGLSISGNIYEAIKTVKFSKEECSLRKLKGPKYMILRNIDIH